MVNISRAMNITRVRIRPRLLTTAVSLSAFATLTAILLTTHSDLSPVLMGPFTAVHGLLASGLTALVVYLALLGALWPLTQIMAGLEAAAKLTGAAGLAALLPFSQVAGPDSRAASGTGGERAATMGHELQIGAYGGYNHTRPSIVRLEQPGETNLTFTDVKWMGESFKTEPYWGVRVSYWNPNLNGLGLMFDYTHAKATAIKDQMLEQSGTRDGEPVPDTEPFGATFRKLEFTHGLNFFTLNALYRNRSLHRWIAPYVGIGIGVSVPHVDMTRTGGTDETRTYEHQITGLAFQALGGIEWRLMKSARASAFTEYKVNYTTNRGRLNGGGTLDTDLWTHQVPVGFSYHHPFGVR